MIIKNTFFFKEIKNTLCLCISQLCIFFPSFLHTLCLICTYEYVLSFLMHSFNTLFSLHLFFEQPILLERREVQRVILNPQLGKSTRGTWPRKKPNSTLILNKEESLSTFIIQTWTSYFIFILLLPLHH
jgi:hypothetical protein